MPTANECIPLPHYRGLKTLDRYYRQVEAETSAAVLSTEPASQCPGCGGRARLWNVHFFREEGRPVVLLCRDCIIARAGGEEKVWLKTTLGRAAQAWKSSPTRRTAERSASQGKLPSGAGAGHLVRAGKKAA
jgi:hypothetical protein